VRYSAQVLDYRLKIAIARIQKKEYNAPVVSFDAASIRYQAVVGNGKTGCRKHETDGKTSTLYTEVTQ